MRSLLILHSIQFAPEHRDSWQHYITKFQKLFTKNQRVKWIKSVNSNILCGACPNNPRFFQRNRNIPARPGPSFPRRKDAGFPVRTFITAQKRRRRRACGGRSDAQKFSMMDTISVPVRFWASRAAAPLCGGQPTRGWEYRAWLAEGSSAYTSRPAA